jgi:DNA-binding GntR family transcriptional regulator
MITPAVVTTVPPLTSCSRVRFSRTYRLPFISERSLARLGGGTLEGNVKFGAGHRPLRDQVADELRKRIIDGDYRAGHRLTEERLADDFGVSRNPVREAIRVLEAEGFLSVQPRRSAIVANVAARDIADLFEVRLSLEVLAARLAAERGSDDDSLERLIAEAKESDDEAVLASLNTRFHATICALSGNELLASLMDRLYNRLQWVYRQSVRERAPHSWAEHERLAKAIRAGDADAAEAAAREHVLAARASAIKDAASPGPAEV